MRLRYRNTIDDGVAFNLFHIRHSPTLRRNVAITTWVLSIAAGIAAFFAINWLPSPHGAEAVQFSAAIAAIITTALCVWTLPRSLRHSMTKQACKLYAEGQNRTFVCEHELEIAEQALIERTPYSQSEARYEVIEHIQITKDYTFIYVSAISAHVIPHERVLEGDCEAFIAEVRKRMPSPAEVATPE